MAEKIDSNEWYTPLGIVTRARRTMGSIDVDPASSAEAQKIVCARLFYDKKEDGLSSPWDCYGKDGLYGLYPSRVFLNPPYSFPLIEKFIDKLLVELDAGRVAQAVVLTNTATDTNWWQKLARVSDAILFHKGRIKFWHPGWDNGSPRHASTICYIGPFVWRFSHAFGNLGLIMARPEKEKATG